MPVTLLTAVVPDWQTAGVFNHEQYCDLVEAEIARLVEVSRDVDPKATVATCGRWRMRTLIHHIGQIHDWVTRIVTSRGTGRLSRRAADYPIPDEPARWPQWLASGGAALLEALRDTDPDTPVYAWGPDQHVRWWARRMVHETGVHRADAEFACGIAPAFDRAVAVDGVDEFLVNLPSAARWAWDVRKLRGDGEVLVLNANDEAVSWRITLEPSRFYWEHGSADGAAAVVEGSAEALYLWVWGRPSQVAVTGDQSLVDKWVTSSAI
jgi:uncharacterized protein (TIGR03083 family)